MRGFLNSTEKRYGIAAFVALLVCFLLLPAYIVWDVSQTVGKLATQVLDMERQHIIERGEQQRFNKTIKARMDSIADENKWVREQESSRAYTRTRTEYFTVTAYTLHPSECGKAVGSPGYGVTASGRRLTEADAYKVVAVDNRYIKFGTRMIIHAPQGDLNVVAADTGGDISGNRLDLFVSEADRGKAFAWGSKRLKVTILQ